MRPPLTHFVRISTLYSNVVPGVAIVDNINITEVEGRWSLLSSAIGVFLANAEINFS